MFTIDASAKIMRKSYLDINVLKTFDINQNWFFASNEYFASET